MRNILNIATFASLRQGTTGSRNGAVLGRTLRSGEANGRTPPRSPCQQDASFQDLVLSGDADIPH